MCAIEPLAQHGGDAPSGGGGSGNRALLCTYLVSNLCILIGDLEAITPIITMFFLLCYMGINISCFVLTRLEQTSFRPTFKYYRSGHCILSVYHPLVSLQCPTTQFDDSAGWCDALRHHHVHCQRSCGCSVVVIGGWSLCIH